MARKVRNSVIVITGASSGIGRATAIECARRGGTIVLSARRAEALRDLASECEHLGGRAVAHPADVNDPDAMKNLARTAIEHFGRIDVWFNNAAVTLAGRFEESPPDVYRQVIETNLFGTINGTRAVLPYMREQGDGVIINHGSVLARSGASHFSAYCTSKFGILGFSESLRQELLGTGIDVSVVMPAAIDTPIYNQAANYSGRQVKPVEPVYNAEDVALAVVGLIERPRRERIVGNAGRGLAALRAIAPQFLTDRVIARQWETDHFKPVPAAQSPGNVFEPDPEHARVSGGWESRSSGPSPLLIPGLLAAGLSALLLWQRRERRRSRIERPEIQIDGRVRDFMNRSREFALENIPSQGRIGIRN